jgi:hypothetical protein
MTDKTADGSIKISAKTAMPKGGSVARHAQVEKYCKCDVRYKGLDALRKDRLKLWYTTMMAVKSISLTAYNLWMKICLLAWPELALFVDYCFYGRWEIFSHTGWVTHDIEITIYNLIFPPRSLGDVVVILVPQLRHGGTTLTKTGFTPTSVSFILPDLDAYGTAFVDIYWHYNPATGALP